MSGPGNALHSVLPQATGLHTSKQKHFRAKLPSRGMQFRVLRWPEGKTETWQKHAVQLKQPHSQLSEFQGLILACSLRDILLWLSRADVPTSLTLGTQDIILTTDLQKNVKYGAFNSKWNGKPGNQEESWDPNTENQKGQKKKNFLIEGRGGFSSGRNWKYSGL